MATGTAELRAALPPALAESLDGWEEHLRLQRDLSEHTVRACSAPRTPGRVRWARGLDSRRPTSSAT
jgi:hypothetical protein